MSQITARRAAVRPRVQIRGSTVAHLLEEVVQEKLHAHREGAIEIIGRAGMGKTTALKHLAEVLTTEQPETVWFLDEPKYDEIEQLKKLKQFVVYTHTEPQVPKTGLMVKLVGWSEDDAIEYLLSKHHDQCRSVMGRIRGSKENQIEYHLLVGCPRLVSIVLDRMARDETVTSVKQCLRDELSVLISDANLRRLCGEYCLDALLQLPLREHKSWKKLQNNKVWKKLNEQTNQTLKKLLRHLYIQRLLAAEELIREISNNETCLLRNPQDHLKLVFEASRLIEADSPAEHNLKRMLSTVGFQALHPLVVSLLHSTGRGWRPEREPIPNLRGAVLYGIHLAEENLCSFDLSGAILCDANLSYAQLDQGCLLNTNFEDANLAHASLSKVKADRAKLQRANMKHVTGRGSSWSNASLVFADLEGAQLNKAWFCGADLSKANFKNAELRGANFLCAKVDEAVFEGVDFTSAILSGLELNLCDLTGACFDSANLNACQLEGVNLPNANFQNAILTNTYWTDSILPNANFQNAVLSGAGLAGIEWEGADLRGADLRGSTFHMGSSRSGLVDSFLASEGTRTGFYTDEYEEQHYKSPEEIRKANLRGADLRGANITGVDFYLVDLRDTKFDEEQRQQLETTGAILFDRD